MSLRKELIIQRKLSRYTIIFSQLEQEKIWGPGQENFYIGFGLKMLILWTRVIEYCGYSSTVKQKPEKYKFPAKVSLPDEKHC